LAARSPWYAERDVNAQCQPPDLVIVDAADRLKTASLEQLRDLFAQLYSRIGFVHQFQPLSGRELQLVIERQWVQLSLDASLQHSADAAVVNAVARITGGNFRLVHRLFAEIVRVLTVNGLSTVTTDVVAFARESLVIGPT
jgi:DNA transposition AAA+ family ATPase